ncbi:hypothetical protein [Hoylesella enoeca]|uniref:hypothetical protein n=1 Tax=Hoylesella enoeca TaxID=76123 RepID=UPI0011DD9F75|nr:hypothetical protein [Hoylesella enoeca]
MKILIYIPRTTDRMKLHHEFVSILSRCLQPMADVKVTVKLPRSIVDYDLIHIIGAWYIHQLDWLPRPNIKTSQLFSLRWEISNRGSFVVNNELNQHK